MHTVYHSLQRFQLSCYNFVAAWLLCKTQVMHGFSMFVHLPIPSLGTSAFPEMSSQQQVQFYKVHVGRRENHIVHI